MKSSIVVLVSLDLLGGSQARGYCSRLNSLTVFRTVLALAQPCFFYSIRYLVCDLHHFPEPDTLNLCSLLQFC